MRLGGEREETASTTPLFLLTLEQFDAAKRERIGLTNSAQHIKAYIDDTIERLGTTPDLYYLHRRDPNTPLEESITALAKLKAEGKCKYIGISEPSAKTLRAACASEPGISLSIILSSD